MQVTLPLLFALLLTACQTAAHNDPAPLVERYLQAKVAGDEQTVRLLLCAEMEHLWRREAASFDGVQGARIDGLACRQRGDQAIVDCQGSILATYGAEQRQFPLGAYRVRFESGEWRWCGEE